ncbi:FkbM family methyltransferase [Dyadobacter aurulentus]|uniref:FkbM family methyltransferase n=1 Tax=Dyadobacter sp. UC 10 TaxID=2605428 RepID=UPI0011F22DA1|nr:FkbM family methyltransferase [Dyadobacter sp. UC 10]KAA0993784.1 FkbM family methyltransferase [Dyadobacter sp. UC 10]
MKNFIRYLLQKTLSFKNYLFLFSLYSIRTIEAGKYEREFLHFIKIIKGDGLILDVGANIGITAAPLAKHHPHAQVHAFEPISENFSTLQRIVNYLKIKNIKLFNIALGSEDGTLKMIMPIRGNSRMQGLSKAYEEGAGEKGTIYDVPLKKLDHIYPFETNISAMKIDVENFELEVLRGSVALLKRNKPMIYCELWDNENRTSVFELLKNIGYQSFTFNNETGSLQPVALREGLPAGNFFFIHS